MSEDDDDYFLPLQDQRVFGAGIKRKRVPFVPASTTDSAASPIQNTPRKSAGDRYLSIVLKPAVDTTNPPSNDDEPPPTPQLSEPQVLDSTQTLCPICHQPLTPAASPSTPAHESSITHQLCLAHSHPPSHLPRTHVGLKYLSSYGWDPDSRLGLGAAGAEGIRVPIKAKAKNDTVGLGVDLEELRVRAARQKSEETKFTRLNAKEVRRKDGEGKKRAEAMRQMFYGKDLEAYLGPGD